jgi:serine/threonine protein kinase
MDRALLFSHSTMTSFFACVGFVLRGCLKILDLVARTLGLQREQLRVSHTDSIPSDAGSTSNVAEPIPSDEDYDAGSILNDADSIPSDAGSIPSDAASISNVAESIPSDEDYDAGSILNDADSISNDTDSIPSHAESIPGDTNSSLRDTNSVAAVTLFKHCRDAATAVRSQCERVRFNKSLCRLLTDTYSRYLHSDFDFTYTNECQTILAELRRVISCGEMLVEQWTDKDWWMSVVSSSDSASIKERVVLHLNEFVFCVQVLRLIASNGAVPEGTSLIPLDLSTPDVEEASRRDSESLFRIVEGYRAKSVPQGAMEKLAELALDKLSVTTSDLGHLQFIEYDDVQLGNFLGRGSFGAVFKCRWLGVTAAAKVSKRYWQSKDVEEEAKLQARLRHPNVVQFIGYAVKQKQHIIVMELMEMDLRMYLNDNLDCRRHFGIEYILPLPLLLAVDIMLQLVEAMNYLHKSGVMHRDLKSDNVLINVVVSEESFIFPSVQVKLTDFAQSKLNLNNSRFTTKLMGATPWRAPEVFEDETNTEKYTNAADVYSFATVFFEVLTGELPFVNSQRIEIHQMVLKGQRPILPPDDYCPKHVSAVTKKCWATRAKDRPQFHEICQMLWQCKARILSRSSPHSSPQKSEPQKHKNDGGDTGCILTTGNSEILSQGHGMMANIRATTLDYESLHVIEYDDVCRGEECLGIGGYAPVFKCQYHGEMVAGKMFRISKIDEVKVVENEANLQARLQHPIVVQSIGYAVTGREHLIVTELMSKDLRMYLDENISEGQARPPLSLLLAVDIMQKMSEGMKYLHESRVMHRDIRANNVLINVVENKELYTSPSVQVKHTDFGMSKLNLNNSRFTTMGRGNAQWRAPEVFQDEQNREKYTNAADVYSFALVFFEVLTGEVPFANISKSQILGKIRCGERPILPPDDYCPVDLSAFIKECWATRPEDRPKFPEICQRLRECKDTILSHSTPNASSQNSKP